MTIQARAEDDEGDGSSWKMQCVDPDPYSNPVVYETTISIPQPVPNPPQNALITITAKSGREANPNLVNEDQFIGTGSVKIGGGPVSSFPNSYEVSCNPKNGAINTKVNLPNSQVKTVMVGDVATAHTEGQLCWVKKGIRE